MAIPWHSLYLFCADNVDTDHLANALRDSLTSLHYTLYDPFGLIPGKAYSQAVRLFLAPLSNSCARVIGAPDLAQLPLLSRVGVCLFAALEGSNALLVTYANGQEADPAAALAPYVRPGHSAEELQRTLNFTGAVVSKPAPDDALPLDALPKDVQAMAGKVNLKQAQKLFSQLSGELLTGNQRDAARQMMRPTDWNGAGGQRIRSVMACLNVPETWRDPDFTTLRDAYQLHARRQRNPHASLYPGDEETMASVPNALDYVPVYGGRDQ